MKEERYVKEQTMIPILDFAPEINALWPDLNTAIQEVLRSGQFIMGPQVAALEAKLAAYLGVRHAIGVNSGTDALVLAMRALNIGPGDEVLTSPFSFFATAEAIGMVGATPVFIDIDPVTYNLDISQVEAHITSRTKAILPVHLYGQAAQMDPLLALANQYGLAVVEDVAQAFGGEYRGKKLGTLGQIGAFSFFPTKTLGAYGDAGLVTTDDDTMAATIRMLRAHGAHKKYYNEVLGYNSRMDTLQAAILLVKLPHLNTWIEGRRQAATRYDSLLADMPGVVRPTTIVESRHVYHQYTIRLNGEQENHRDVVQKRLAEAGVGTMVYYPVPIHRLPYYANTQLRLPNAEQASQQVLSLPIWPQITAETQQIVVDALRASLA
jgi:dTDP-4-amino-4,6-dideoxygalactose transaminase